MECGGGSQPHGSRGVGVVGEQVAPTPGAVCQPRVCGQVAKPCFPGRTWARAPLWKACPGADAEQGWTRETSQETRTRAGAVQERVGRAG